MLSRRFRNHDDGDQIIFAAAGIVEDRPIRTKPVHEVTKTHRASDDQYDVWCMIGRRAAAGGIGNQIFRATGITAYLANGRARKAAARITAATTERVAPPRA